MFFIDKLLKYVGSMFFYIKYVFKYDFAYDSAYDIDLLSVFLEFIFDRADSIFKVNHKYNNNT